MKHNDIMSDPPSSRERDKTAEEIDDAPDLVAEEIESKHTRSDGKIELTEHEAYDKLGFSYPTWKKWTILTVIFMVQVGHPSE